MVKIRQGFVSNSSSSSFIVGEDFTLEQVTEIMFEIEQEAMEEGIYIQDKYVVKEKTKADYNGWNKYYNIPDRKMIVVEDLDDNGLDYEIFWMIESRLNAERLHLG